MGESQISAIINSSVLHMGVFGFKKIRALSFGIWEMKKPIVWKWDDRLLDKIAEYGQNPSINSGNFDTIAGSFRNSIVLDTNEILFSDTKNV